jgi:hypothetical protein
MEAVTQLVAQQLQGELFLLLGYARAVHQQAIGLVNGHIVRVFIYNLQHWYRSYLVLQITENLFVPGSFITCRPGSAAVSSGKCLAAFQGSFLSPRKPLDASVIKSA